MPQPYRRKASLTYGPEALLARPQLSRHIGAIAAQWTGIEQTWGYILALLLGTDAEAGLPIYLALNSEAARGHIITNIASARLTGPLRTRFGELWVQQRARAEERNRLVHGWWGYDPLRDDFIALGERGHTERRFAYLVGGPEARERGRALQHRALAYVEADFLAIEKRMDEFASAQADLLFALFHAPLARRSVELLQSLRLLPEPSARDAALIEVVEGFQSRLREEYPGLLFPDAP